MDYFPEISEQQLRQERDKARELRRSQWWQNRIAAGVCHYCGCKVAPKALTLDHVVPLVRGGRSTRGNCVPCCKECNNQKKHLLPVEWQEHLERLGKEKAE
ncbi:MAG: HNH endonuclease signature motif containing protein [Syntrophotaleaceae bacterium]